MRYLSLILIFVFLISCTNSKSRLRAGQKAPDFSLYTPQKEKISIKNYQGKYLLIHFWADWCSQCRAEFPKLENSYQYLKNQKFEIIAVNAGQSAEHVRDFIEFYNITFPMVMDEDLKVSKQYSVAGLPTNYFIDDKGTVFKIIIGWVNQEQIIKILGEMKNEVH